MNQLNRIDLSTVFRRQLDQSSDESVRIKEQYMEQKRSKIESRATSFLLDKKYALKLDELM